MVSVTSGRTLPEMFTTSQYFQWQSIDYHTVGEMKGWAAMTDQVRAGVVGRVAALGCGEGGRAEGGRVY